MPVAPAKLKPVVLPLAIGIGSPAVWRCSPSDPDPSPALVTAISSNGMASLIVFPRDIRVGLLKDTVRHSSDQEWADQESGCWDYTEDQKALIALITRK